MRANPLRPGRSSVGQFGEKFRKEREKKNFSLDHVSHVIKIGTRMLQAIEEENFDRLPGGVFNKGFIRAYAKHLGMNDEKAVADYLDLVRQTQINAHEAWEPAPPTQNRKASPEKRAPAASKKSSPNQSAAKAQPSTQVEELPDLQLPRAEHVRRPRNKYLDNNDAGIPWRILALAGVVLVLALILWNRHSRNAHAQAAAAAPAKSAPLGQSAPASVPASTPAPASYQTASARSANPLAASPHSSAPGIQPTPIAQSASPVRSPAGKPVINTAENDGTTGAAQPANSAPVKAAPLTLIIRASENSWISVRADGQEVTQETLIAPAHTSVRATREIVVKTGNAAGINFLWNGKEIPADGTEAEVRTFIFDAAGMRTTPAAQPPAQNQ